MAGMAGQFLSGCESKYFRDKIVAQLSGAKVNSAPDPNSEDQMEQFLAQNTPEQLEQFIFQNSCGNREEYLSLTAEMLLTMRKCRGKPGQGREALSRVGGAAQNGDRSDQNGACSDQNGASSDQSGERSDQNGQRSEVVNGDPGSEKHTEQTTS